MNQPALVLAGTCLIAGTYGLVRLAYGLFLPDIATSLSMSTTTSGLISSAASIAYCLGALIGLTAGTRARQIVTAAMGTAALGSLGMAVSPDTMVLAPAAVLSSMGAGLASPAMVVIIERNVLASARDRAQAVVNAGTGPGLVAAGVLALVLLPHWRWGFVVSAVFTAVAGLAVLVLDRSHPHHCQDAEPLAGSTPARRGTGHRAGRDHGALLVPAVGALLLGGGSSVVWTYGRALLIEQGAGDLTSTIAWVMLGLGGTAAVLTAAQISRLTPERAWQISLVGVGVSIAVLALLAEHLLIAFAACLLFGWGFVTGTSALITWASRRVPGRAAAGTSALFVILVLGQALGSTIAAAIEVRFGLSAAFGLASAMTIVAVACGRRREPTRDHRGRRPPVGHQVPGIEDDEAMSCSPNPIIRS